jgi:hypothetical protein
LEWPRLADAQIGQVGGICRAQLENGEQPTQTLGIPGGNGFPFPPRGSSFARTRQARHPSRVLQSEMVGARRY